MVFERTVVLKNIGGQEAAQLVQAELDTSLKLPVAPSKSWDQDEKYTWPNMPCSDGVSCLA